MHTLRAGVETAQLEARWRILPVAPALSRTHSKAAIFKACRAQRSLPQHMEREIKGLLVQLIWTILYLPCVSVCVCPAWSELNIRVLKPTVDIRKDPDPGSNMGPCGPAGWSLTGDHGNQPLPTSPHPAPAWVISSRSREAACLFSQVS